LTAVFSEVLWKPKWFKGVKLTQEIVAKTESLTDFSEIGRAVPEINEPNIRELIVYSYRLVY
jgi:hypothetical protein